MDTERRTRLQVKCREVLRRIALLRAARNDSELIAEEGDLLDELDSIEFELGLDEILLPPAVQSLCLSGESLAENKSPERNS